jgi:histidine triad (HIT) family protein
LLHSADRQLLNASCFSGPRSHTSQMCKSVTMCRMSDCLFCNIVAGKIPSKKVYEDDRTFVFEDVRPQAPTHVLIIPKKHIVDIKEATLADAEIIGYCQLVAAKLAKERGIEQGYRTVYNVGPDSGQSVFHLHLHLLGGRKLGWPPG